jgi:hypothetical protein
MEFMLVQLFVGISLIRNSTTMVIPLRFHCFLDIRPRLTQKRFSLIQIAFLLHQNALSGSPITNNLSNVQQSMRILFENIKEIYQISQHFQYVVFLSQRTTNWCQNHMMSSSIKAQLLDVRFMTGVNRHFKRHFHNSKFEMARTFRKVKTPTCNAIQLIRTSLVNVNFFASNFNKNELKTWLFWWKNEFIWFILMFIQGNQPGKYMIVPIKQEMLPFQLVASNKVYSAWFWSSKSENSEDSIIIHKIEMEVYLTGSSAVAASSRGRAEQEAPCCRENNLCKFDGSRLKRVVLTLCPFCLHPVSIHFVEFACFIDSVDGLNWVTCFGRNSISLTPLLLW